VTLGQFPTRTSPELERQSLPGRINGPGCPKSRALASSLISSLNNQVRVVLITQSCTADHDFEREFEGSFSWSFWREIPRGDVY
jgi:hypothetical protein